MGRDEVLKVMGRQIMERPGVLERFLREIRAVAKLRHPNIVAAYSAFRLSDSIVFAMEYVEGLDLARMVKAKGPLPVAHACAFIHQAALGLQHAHEQGLVHRDIKPGNLMLSRSGDKATVKVLDFGLAKVTREEKVDGGLTTEGQALGTPDFIAPEQIIDAPSADIRADIYSLGGTLYYLLTGRPPFRANSLYDIFQAHISREADPLNLVRPEVPSELAALVAKMMAKDPERRFQVPGEVAVALSGFFKKGARTLPAAGPELSQPSQPATARSNLKFDPESAAENDRAATALSLLEAQTDGLLRQPTGREMEDVRSIEHGPDALSVTTSLQKRRLVWIAAAVGLILLGGYLGGSRLLPRLISHSSTQILPFNGRDFEGWTGFKNNTEAEPATVFRIDNGDLVSASDWGRVFVDKPYADFSFSFQYLFPSEGSNGMALCLLKFDEGEAYQVGQAGLRASEVGCTLTKNSGKFGTSGDLIGFEPGTRAPTGVILPSSLYVNQPAGAWHNAVVHCQGRSIRFRLDGQEVNHIEAARTILCHPGFMYNNSNIRIRHIRIELFGEPNSEASGRDALQAGTRWNGRHEMVFPATNSNRSGSVTLNVVERDRYVFKAVLTHRDFTWDIQGTIHDGRINWMAKNVTVRKGVQQAVDTAGIIRGDEITLRHYGFARHTDGSSDQVRGSLTLRLEE
jgi:serine/threonine protein kinase